MKLFFYPRLALRNIRKNAKIYIPYLLTSTFTVAMLYIIHSLSVNGGYESLKLGKRILPVIMDLGTWVVMIFAIIFLFYINSFIIKRRKKEVALYNILGMEKKHIMYMMFYETLITSLFSLTVGILFGIIFSKLLFLVLIHLAHISTPFQFVIPMESVLLTCTLFIPIYFVSYLFNVIQIQLSNPIELLRSGQTGEKEPKVKWILTLIGLGTLGSGYYIAQTIENPVEAMLLFFVAVVLVIIGTYCLFTAGSITLLKILKKNRKFYYKTRHFTSVSQMIYRMKQNAVGLASICILCTCILVMLSSTVCLYISVQDSSNMMVNEQLRLVLSSSDDNNVNSQEINQIYDKCIKQFQLNGIEVQTVIKKKCYLASGNYSHQKFSVGRYNQKEHTSITAMSLDEFNQAFHKNLTLKENEILAACNFETLKDSLTINNKVFNIKAIIDEPYFLGQKYSDIDRDMTVVFNNDKILNESLFNTDYFTKSCMYISIDFKDIKDSVKALDIVENHIPDDVDMYSQSQYELQEEYLEVFGSLFFLGIFLGVMFLMAAILIMYYKQLSEGYEDQKRYEIMQNVGMSRREVKQSIRSQVLIFFFLPLVVATIHMAFAFKMIVKMFSFLVLSDLSLFIWCTVISSMILAIIYSIVYYLTAKVYYRIVRVE